jgi:3-phosphoshikimate 1-carboxyvinyltransferase
MNVSKLLTLTPVQALDGLAVRLPGSKSYTIRALLLAAMTSGPVVLKDPLLSDDTRAMMSCLNALGLQASWLDEQTVCVDGHISQIMPDTETLLDCDLSAASLRFLVALASILPGVQVIQGKSGLNKRPVRDLINSLRALGAEIDYLDQDGFPPVRVKSSTLQGHAVNVSGATSSQYLSALMMIAPALGGLTLTVEGELISRPYLDMTAEMMRHFGVESEMSLDGLEIVVSAGQQYRALSYQVEGDASAAAYPLAAATLTGQTLTLENLPPSSIQADMRFILFLEAMGNRVWTENGKLHYQGKGIKPMTLDMRDCPDQAQTMAVLLSFAPGTSRIEGLRSLRVKETDRLSAVAQELRRMGVTVEEEAEALVIHGGNPQIANIATYGDHRMAMAFAVAGTRLDGLVIEDPGVVAKTYPDFWQDCPQWGIGVQNQDSPKKEAVESSETLASEVQRKAMEMNISAVAVEAEPDTFTASEKIVLIGFMGAGKSEIAPLLAQRLGLPLLDTDQMAIATTSYASVGELFSAEGETCFRELELEAARSLRGPIRGVIATGGGLVMNKLAMDYLAENATIIYLEAALETLLARLAKDATPRPLLHNPLSVQTLYDLRVPLYRHYANCHIATDGESPQAVLEKICQALNSYDLLSTSTEMPHSPALTTVG